MGQYSGDALAMIGQIGSGAASGYFSGDPYQHRDPYRNTNADDSLTNAMQAIERLLGEGTERLHTPLAQQVPVAQGWTPVATPGTSGGMPLATQPGPQRPPAEVIDRTPRAAPGLNTSGRTGLTPPPTAGTSGPQRVNTNGPGTGAGGVTAESDPQGYHAANLLRIALTPDEQDQAQGQPLDYRQPRPRAAA